MTYSLNSLSRILVYGVLFSSMVFSGALSAEKTVLVALAVTVASLDLFSRWREISSYSLFNLILLYLIFTFFFLVGLHKGYAIEGNVLRIYLATPLIAFFLGSAFRGEEDIAGLFDFLIMTHVGILIINMLFVVNALAQLNIPIFDNHMFALFFVDERGIQFRTLSHTAMMFTAPLFISWFIHKRRLQKKAAYIFIFFLTILLVVLSGRRALQIIVLLSLICSIILVSMQSRSLNLRFVLIGVVSTFLLIITLPLLLGIANPFELVVTNFMNALDPSSRGGSIRSEQAEALLSGINAGPLFGEGTHSFIRSYIASDNPYSYELVYLALIYQLGLLAFLTLVLLFGLYLKHLLQLAGSGSKEIRAKYVCFIIATLCFIIASATNPMLYMPWFWIILAGFANSRGLGERRPDPFWKFREMVKPRRELLRNAVAGLLRRSD